MSDTKFCASCGKPHDDDGWVTLSVEAFQKLLESSLKPSEKPLKGNRFRAYGGTKIHRDPELAEFIVTSSETKITREVHAACIARFGEDRTPSTTSINRFLDSLPHEVRAGYI